MPAREDRSALPQLQRAGTPLTKEPRLLQHIADLLRQAGIDGNLVAVLLRRETGTFPFADTQVLDTSLTIEGNGSIAAFRVINYGAGLVPFISLLRSRGTREAPSTVLSGDTLGRYQFGAEDGNGFGTGVIIEAAATENWTDTAHGTALHFVVVGPGSTSQTRRATVDAGSGAGTTGFLLWDVNVGALQRVKVGANNTGPGGTGRALYIDNV